MKSALFFVFLIYSISAGAQTKFTSTEAQELVDIFFKGFHEGDTLKMKSVMADKVPMQTAMVNRDGLNVVRDGSVSDLLNAIASRTSEQRWEEKLLDYKVQVDGNLAHVWTPYEFWFNGEFSHCGANSFTLAKTDSGWKIIHIIDSRRKESCKQ